MKKLTEQFSLVENRRLDIQVLRGISVIAVLMFHLSPQQFPVGYLGVDIFFAISGFVLAPIFLNRNIDFTQIKLFWLRRFWRLAPALSTVVISFGIMIFLFGPILDHQRISRQAILSLFGLGNLGAVRYSGDYFSPNQNPFIHTWSLSVEEQFYFVFPLIMALFYRKASRTNVMRSSFLAAIFCVSFALWFLPKLQEPIYLFFGNDFAKSFTFYSPIGRVWEFLIGVAAYLFRKKYNLNVKVFSSLQVILLTFIVTVLILPVHKDFRFFTIILLLITFFQLFLGSSDFKLQTVLPQMVWIGNRSYSIYLVHVPLIYILQTSPIFREFGDDNALLVQAFSLLSSVLLGHLIYSKIENRFKGNYLVEQDLRKSLKSGIYSFLFPVVLLLSIDSVAGYGLLKDTNFPPQNQGLRQVNNCSGVEVFLGIDDFGCRYGSDLDNSVFLIGDSHASANLPAMRILSKKYGQTLIDFSRPGCGFFLEEVPTNSKFSFPSIDSDCINHNRRVFQLAEKVKPSFVVISLRSSSSLVKPSNSQSRALYNEILYENYMKLRSKVEKVEIVGSESEYLAANSVIQILFRKEGAWSQIPFEDRAYWSKKLVGKASYIDSLKVLCPNDKCINKIGNSWLFSDGDHLTVFGSMKLLPLFEARFRLNLGTQDSLR